uniref:Uncharacterized protein n=1 Tax=Callorhinchus milii TaxID=7868 RepID=A0A4W3HLB0_CALMI
SPPVGKDAVLNKASGEQDKAQLQPGQLLRSPGPVASNKEICQLLAQFSLKHINEAEAPDNKVMMEEARLIKDFLQNNMFSLAGDKKPSLPPPLPPPLLPPPPPPLPPLPPLPPPPRSWRPRPPGWSDRSSTRKKTWPPLAYLRGGSLRQPLPGGSLTMPSRPPLINYPPPVPPAPPAPPTSSYSQHQAFYQPRPLRMAHQPTAYQQQQPSCFVRQTNPYNYSQMGQEYVPRQTYIRATYAPLVGYWSFVPEYSYTAPRNAPKPLAPGGGSNNPPPMAGDGPQCLFQPAYGYVDTNMAATRFNSGRSGPVYNNNNFQMYYPADGSGYNYW